MLAFSLTFFCPPVERALAERSFPELAGRGFPEAARERLALVCVFSELVRVFPEAWRALFGLERVLVVFGRALPLLERVPFVF